MSWIQREASYLFLIKSPIQRKRCPDLDFDNISIRKMIHSDMDEAIVLLKELFDIENDFEFNEAKQRKGMKMLLDSPNMGFILVAEWKSSVIGMCTIQFLISTAEGGTSGYIEDMVVEEKFRRHGVGSMLLNYMEKWSKENGLLRLSLLVDQDNKPAINFYNKLSWHKTHLICYHKK